MIFVDSNVPMYLVGGPHPHKTDAQRLLERLVLDKHRLVSDAEVLQEILHRYLAIRRPECVPWAFDALLGVVDETFPVTIDDVRRAKDIALGMAQVSARDAIHLAVMEHHGVTELLSFDRGFDGFPGVTRIS